MGKYKLKVKDRERILESVLEHLDKLGQYKTDESRAKTTRTAIEEFIKLCGQKLLGKEFANKILDAEYVGSVYSWSRYAEGIIIAGNVCILYDTIKELKDYQETMKNIIGLDNILEKHRNRIPICGYHYSVKEKTDESNKEVLNQVQGIIFSCRYLEELEELLPLSPVLTYRSRCLLECGVISNTAALVTPEFTKFIKKIQNLEKTDAKGEVSSTKSSNI